MLAALAFAQAIAVATAPVAVPVRASATIVAARVLIVAGRVSAPAMPPRERPCTPEDGRCRLIIVDLP